jgi:hypothetical protein
MRNHPVVFMFAIAGAVACGGPAGNDFTDPAGGSGTGTGGKGGGAATGGKGGAGGTSGSSSGGKGGTSGTSGSSSGTSSTTGGSSGTGGDTGGSGGTAGDAMGGTSSETGGTAGTAGTGAGGSAGTGGTVETGGSAGDAMGGTGTGGTTETGGAGGTMAGTGGTTGSPDCEKLTQAYATALEEAKACNANSGKDQCTEQFASNLSCGCPVFVNPENKDAIAELQRLQKEGAKCMTVCPAIACVEPGSGVCEPADGTANENGLCTTSFGLPQ